MMKTTRSARAGQDRWLVSYADFVTLLFAFFTTLYAAQAVNATSRGASPDAPGSGHPERAVSPVIGSGVSSNATPAPKADVLRDRLASVLEADVRLERADITRDERGLVVSLPEQATFDIGSAEVTPDARPLIARVVSELRNGPYTLRIEGHTDDVPIKTARYRSNWELSTARAGAVVAYLISDLEVSPSTLSAAGYAEFHPRVPNDSSANRARNRRIDIVVIETEEAFASEAPGP